jgi:hypothetical protein
LLNTNKLLALLLLFGIVGCEKGPVEYIFSCDVTEPERYAKPELDMPLIINTKLKSLKFADKNFTEKYLNEEVYIHAENHEHTHLKVTFNKLNGDLRFSFISEGTAAISYDYGCKKVEPLIE